MARITEIKAYTRLPLFPCLFFASSPPSSILPPSSYLFFFLCSESVNVIFDPNFNEAIINDIVLTFSRSSVVPWNIFASSSNIFMNSFLLSRVCLGVNQGPLNSATFGSSSPVPSGINLQTPQKIHKFY